MLIPTDIAVKLKENKGIKQVKRFKFRSNRIGFNSVAALLTPLIYKPKNKILLRLKKNLDVILKASRSCYL
jgi:hypothetical protein